MNDSQKPFACVEKGCEMTFTNEDHLNWHQKKHDMMLNLGLTKNNDVADQTPTPTRFIRNCEEVGLFQDLQNVNPFDEFFKKAVEVAKNGGTLEIPQNNSDDTLHTPHILPHIEENQKKITSTNQDDNNSQSNDFSLSNVIPMTPNGDTEKTPEKNTITKCNCPVIVIDDDSNDVMDVKKKIKEALQNKEKQRVKASANSGGITVVPFQTLAAEKQTDTKCCVTVNKQSPTERVIVIDEREKIKEMNRAAQIRCRKRKQKRWLEMEESLSLLKAENQKLKMENYNLQQELLRMRGQTADTPDEAIQGTIIGTLIPVIGRQEAAKRAPPLILRKRINSPAHPEPSTVNSLVYKLAVSDDNMRAISPKRDGHSMMVGSPTISDSPEETKVKKRCLRKIIPKIIIEN